MAKAKKVPFGGKRHTGREPGVGNAPPMLRDMRWAYENLGTSAAGTVQQEGFRDELVGSRSAFLSRLERMEKEWQQKQVRMREIAAAGGAISSVPAGKSAPAVPQQPPAAAVPDLGTAHCLELVGRLIREWKEAAERGAGE